MNIALFIATAIGVYLLSEWIIKYFERQSGGPIGNRQIIFFIVFFALILTSFELLKILLGQYR